MTCRQPAHSTDVTLLRGTRLSPWPGAQPRLGSSSLHVTTKRGCHGCKLAMTEGAPA